MPATTDATTDAATATVRCSRCQRENPLPSDTAGFRCRQCKAFLPGNASRLKTGLRRFRRTPTLPADLQQSVADFREQLIADQGGLSELSAVRGGLIRLLVGAETAFRLAGNELSRQGGVHNPGGRAAFAALLTASQTWVRIAERLGIERRPKEAGHDIRAWWAANSQPTKPEPGQ